MGQFSALNTGHPTGTDNADVTAIAARIDNVESGLTGTSYLPNIDVRGGFIDGTPIGNTTAAAGTFTTINASGATVLGSNVTVSGALYLTGSMVVGSTITYSGVVVMNASVTLNSHVTVNGSAVFTSQVTSSGVIVASSFTGKQFGAWDPGSPWVKSSNYQAASDLLVCAYAASAGANISLVGYTDATATPTTLIIRSGTSTVADNYANITMPVKKGDYWRVECGGTPNIIIIPIGA